MVETPTNLPLEAILALLQQNPCTFGTYPKSDGRCMGGKKNIPITAPDYLSQPPLVSFTKLLDAQLAANPDATIQVLGVGEMCAIDLVALARQYENKHVHFTATNHDPNFSIQCALEEAERRLNLFGSYEQHWMYLEQLQPNSNNYQLLKNHPPLLSRQQLEFLIKNKHRITYMQPVDTIDLPQQLAEQGINHIDIVHESFGGIARHPKMSETLTTIYEILSPSGILMTSTTYIEYYSHDTPGFKKLTKYKTERDDYIYFAQPDFELPSDHFMKVG